MMDDVEDSILKVTLNRLEAFNREVLYEFIEKVENADEDDSAGEDAYNCRDGGNCLTMRL